MVQWVAKDKKTFVFRAPAGLEEAVDEHPGALEFRPVGSDRAIHMWYQFNISQDIPGVAEGLGDMLMERFGKHITFGEMLVPNQNAVLWVGWHQSGPVWVRNIGTYQVGSDEVVQVGALGNGLEGAS